MSINVIVLRNFETAQASGITWPVLAQLIVAAIALASPFLIHGIDAARHWLRRRDRAKRVWSVIQKEARIIAQMLEEADGHFRTRDRWADHTNLMQQIEPSAIVAAPSEWVSVLDPEKAKAVVDLSNGLLLYNNKVEHFASVKAETSRGRNVEFVLNAIESLWHYLVTIDQSIYKPAYYNNGENQQES